MGKLTKKEFAELCGIRTNHIATLSKRGKIYVDANGMIDDDNDLNRLFIESKGGVVKPKSNKKTASKQNANEEIPETKVKVKTQSKKKEAPATTEEGVRYQESILRYNTEKRKSELDIQIKELSAEEKRMKNERSRGEVIPAFIITSLFKEYSAAKRQSEYDILDNFLILIATKTKMSSEYQSAVRRQINELLNVADIKAVEVAKKKINVIVGEYTKAHKK